MTTDSQTEVLALKMLDIVHFPNGNIIFPFPKREVEDNIREVKHDVNGRRQTAKIPSDFESFSSKP